MYLCSGLLPPLAFADCVTGGTAAFVANAAYLKKLPIPEPVSVATAGTLGLAVDVALSLGVAVALRHRPGWKKPPFRCRCWRRNAWGSAWACF